MKRWSPTVEEIMTTGPQDSNLGDRAPGQPDPHPGGDQPYGGPQQPQGNPQQPQGIPPQTYGGQQQPYPAGMSQTASGPGRPGELLTRFLARILDGIIVAIPTAIVVVLLQILGRAMGSVGEWLFGILAAIVYVIAVMGYFSWMEANKGQTLGKLVLKLRTEGPSGGNPTMQQAFKRNSFYLITLAGVLLGAVVSIGILWILGSIIQVLAGIAGFVVVIMIAVSINSSPTKQGMHDKFAGGTRVVTTE